MNNSWLTQEEVEKMNNDCTKARLYSYCYDNNVPDARCFVHTEDGLKEIVTSGRRKVYVA